MRPKDIGTRAESAVVRFLHDNGFPGAERKPLSGRHDRSDVNVTAGIVAQVKAGEMAATASINDIRKWAYEVDQQRRNAGADVNLLVVRQRRRPVGYWHAWTTVRQLDIVRGGISVPIEPDTSTQVMLLLTDWCDLARQIWGDDEA